MENEKQRALGLGLRRIIETDQKANVLLSAARDKAAEIQEGTRAEKAQILKEAQEKRDEVSKQVQAEEEKIVQTSCEQTQQQCDIQKQALYEKVQQNRKKWVEDMVDAITKP